MEDRELQKLKKEKQRAEKKNNLKEVAQLCNVIGELYAKHGKYEDAIAEHETELGLSEALADTIGTAIGNRKIGECYCELGDFKKALNYQKRHLELAQSCGSVIEEQRAWATIGRTYLFQAEAMKEPTALQGVLKKGEKAFLKSLECCEKLKGDVPNTEYMEMKARLFLNLGLIFDNKRDVNESSKFIKQAIYIAEKHSLYEDLYRCQFSLSGIYRRHNKLSQALRLIEEAHKCAQKMKDKSYESDALSTKAQIFLQLGDFAAAKRCLKKSHKLGNPVEEERLRIIRNLKTVIIMCASQENLEQISKTDFEGQMKLYEKLGDGAAHIGNYKQALGFYSNMLRCAESSNLSGQALIPIYLSLAQTYRDDNQYSKAVEYFCKELECRKGDPEQECRTWLNIAEAKELSGCDYETASQAYLAAFMCAKKAKHRRLQMQSLKSLTILQESFQQSEDFQNTQAKLEQFKTKYGISSEDEESEEEDSQAVVEDEDVDLDALSETDESENEEFDRNTATVNGEIRKSRRRKNYKVNEMGETPLHRACIEGNLSKVKKLIEEGHPVNPRDYCGWLPLHEAANHDQYDIVEYLLDHGAWVNDRGGDQCGGITALHDAANCGNVTIMELLISRGASVIAKDDEGNAPLDSLLQYKNRSGNDMDFSALTDIQNMESKLRAKMGSKGSKKSMVTDLRSDIFSADDELPELERPSSREKQRNKRPRHDNSHISKDIRYPSISNEDNDGFASDVDEDQLYTNAILDEVETIESAEDARTAYQQAMSGIGSSAARCLLSQRNQAVVDRDSSAGPALVSEEEHVGSDWLVEDVRPAKRKKMDIDGVFTTNNTRQRGDRQQPMSPVKRQTESNNVSAIQHDGENSVSSINEINERDFEIIDDDDNITVVPSTQRQSIRTSTQRPRQKRQLKLTQFGTQRSTTPTSDLDNDSTDHMDSGHVLSSSVAVQGEPVPSEQVLQNVMRVKVKVKDKLLLIPVLKSDTSKTIEWLAHETSQRYYDLVGLRPVVQLGTKDGALFSNSDLISLVISNDEVIEATRIDWDMPPLTDRYNQACQVLKTTAYRNIRTCLQKCQTSTALSLDNLGLRSKQVHPIFRALQYQTNIKELCLKGNRLGDEGFQHLVDVLPTLPNLTTLDLTSNEITQNGLKALAEVMDTVEEKQKTLQLLETLSLSFNPLGDGCMLSLCSVLRHLPLLIKLDLQACHFSVRLFQQHRMALAQAFQENYLQALDISYNTLDSTGVELLLKCLRHQSVLCLDVSATVQCSNTSHVTKHLEYYLKQAGCALQILIMNDCHLSSESLGDLTRGVASSKSLQHLSLSTNQKIRNSDISRLLDTTCRFDGALEKLTVIGSGITSPLNTDFIDSVSSKVHHEHSLNELKFSCTGLNKIDIDILKQVWQDRWGEHSKCDVIGDVMHLKSKV